MFTDPSFWYGVLALPLFIAALIAVAWLYRTFWDIWKVWFIGLPIIGYPAMALVLVGMLFLHRKYCFILRANGRLWLSPKVKYFVDPKTIK